ncbi:MAG: D-aminoacyl-tRNA deacylase [Planctomycetaceae bacterium]
MRAVLQRVTRAQVSVDGEVIGQIGPGLVILLGVAQGDTQADVDWMAEKVIQLRLFEDAAGKTNLSTKDVAGGLLVISQFTLLADCRNGRRPSFTAAAPPEEANQLYEAFVAACRQSGLPVQTGKFRADMQVELVNDGPVTVMLDSKKTF